MGEIDRRHVDFVKRETSAAELDFPSEEGLQKVAAYFGNVLSKQYAGQGRGVYWSVSNGEVKKLKITFSGTFSDEEKSALLEQLGTLTN